MKVIGSFRSALSRQVSEAVRIRRRGGAGSILNSKTEFNRCHIPRLRLEEEEEVKQREEQLLQEMEHREEQWNKEQAEWEASRTKKRDMERRSLVKGLGGVKSRSLKETRSREQLGGKGRRGGTAC